MSVTIGSIAAALSGERGMRCRPGFARPWLSSQCRRMHRPLLCWPLAAPPPHPTLPHARARAPHCAGVSGHAHRHWGDDFSSGAVVVRLVSMVMLGLSIIIAIWSGYNFNHRANMLT